MIASELISNHVFPLKKSDSAQAALLLMDDFGVKHLPVVDQQKVLGFVSNQQLQDDDARVEELMQLQINAYCINESAHLFDVLAKLNEHHLSSLAVIDNDQMYKGIISAVEMVNYIQQQTALAQPGATMALQMPVNSYTLAEISRIAESNDAKILGLLVQPVKESAGLIQVHLKLSKTNVRDVAQSFERFGYQIVYASNTFEDDEGLKQKLDWLMKYLNT